MSGKSVKKVARELINDGSVEEILAACYRSLPLFIEVFLKDYFTRPFSKRHEAIFEVLDDREKQQVAIIGFRGFGKTTLIQAYTTRALLLDDTRFVVMMSATHSLAQKGSLSLRNEIVRNAMIRQVFGELKPVVEEQPFSVDFWTLNVGDHVVAVMPRGSGQQVRGALYEGRRPDLLISDDIENPPDLRTPESVERFKSWFWGDYMNCVDRSRKDWRHIVIGTITSPMSILFDVIDSGAWEVVEVPLCDDEFRSTWVSFMSDDDVRKLYKEMSDAGATKEFFREYMNRLVADDGVGGWSSRMFKHYSGNVDGDDVVTVVLVDPAKTSSAESGRTGIVVVKYKRETGEWYVHDVVVAQLTPNDIYSTVARLAKQYGASVIGVEETGIGDFIKHPFITYMMKEGVRAQVVFLKTGNVKKEDRIRQLLSYYQRGVVYHNSGRSGRLEMELLAFPYGKETDAADALAYFPKLLANAGEYGIDKKDDYVSLEEAIMKDWEEYGPPIRTWTSAWI